MKVSREQAAENRRRILESASRLFREKGFDGVGVADIMKEAGLTHGGFYGHFESKEDLARQACASACSFSESDWAGFAKLPAGEALGAFVASYLSPTHRDDPGHGCLFAALGADVARQQGPARRIFTEGLSARIDQLAPLAQGRSKAAQREQAVAALAALVGALVLSRAVDDDALSDEILRATAVFLRPKPVGRPEKLGEHAPPANVAGPPHAGHLPVTSGGAE